MMVFGFTSYRWMGVVFLKDGDDHCIALFCHFQWWWHGLIVFNGVNMAFLLLFKWWWWWLHGFPSFMVVIVMTWHCFFQRSWWWRMAWHHHIPIWRNGLSMRVSTHVMLDLRWKLNDCQGVPSSHWAYIYGYKLAAPSFGMLYVQSIVYKSRNQPNSWSFCLYMLLYNIPLLLL
mgnify:CR=1 FL=1